MYKVSLVFWSMGELGILLSRFADLWLYVEENSNGAKKVQNVVII